MMRKIDLCTRFVIKTNDLLYSSSAGRRKKRHVAKFENVGWDLPAFLNADGFKYFEKGFK